MAHEKIRTMRTIQCAPGGAVTLAAFGKRGAIAFLDIHGGAVALLSDLQTG